jgi:TPP-dependent trihydroxycyclohexane-1,2-dione (THcHDO) dehydratase
VSERGQLAARPDRPVVCISGDGSAMYSIQALWTATHCGLPVVFVILANGERFTSANIPIAVCGDRIRVASAVREAASPRSARGPSRP